MRRVYTCLDIYIDKLMNKARGDRIYVTPRSVCVYIGPMQGRCREVVFAFVKVDISARPDGSLHFYEGASIYRAITPCAQVGKTVSRFSKAVTSSSKNMFTFLAFGY